MPTRIDAIATERQPSHGARRLADDAIAAALASAGIAPTDLDLLVNCGIYRDRNLGEPALASLIQEDVGANPGHPPIGEHGTFSFDVAAGTCGPLVAVQIVDGFLCTGVARHAVVVASDADPGHGLAVDFPFDAAGAAALLSWAPTGSGFTRFHQRVFPEHEKLLRAEVQWTPRASRLPWRAKGHNVLTIERSDELVGRSIECATVTVRDWLRELGDSVSDLDHLIVTDGGGVGQGLADALGLPGTVAGAGVHTAAILFSLAQARDAGRLEETRTLVVTVGAGIEVSCALHEPAVTTSHRAP